MNSSKNFVSGIAATLLVGAIGLAYAQTTEGTSPPTTTETQTIPSAPTSSSTNPSGMLGNSNSSGMNSGSTTPGSDTNVGTSMDTAPQADRN